MSRITGLSVLLCTGMMVWATPGYAGFEFTAPAAPAPKQESAPAMAAPDAPMPIVPMGAVTSEPLAAPGTVPTAPMAAMPALSPVPDHVLSLPVSAAKPAGSTEPVYVRRERSTITVKAPKNEPMDTEALLKATQNGDSVALTQASMDQMQAQQDGQLLINPYPLQGQAVHGGDMGTLPVQQAMMEEGGTLRPVAIPGSNTQGMRARAKITSRYDAGDQYMDRTPAQPAMAAANGNSILTPIPGGEGQPLNTVEQMPLPPMQVSQREPVAPPAPLIPAKTSMMPRPAIPQDYPVAANAPAVPQETTQSGYADAVGFGRDLPLALALSQVVPAQYSYSFAQNVNVGSTVSWQGGKPWNQVLDEMLAQSGMKAVIQNNQITIQNANS